MFGTRIQILPLDQYSREWVGWKRNVNRNILRHLKVPRVKRLCPGIQSPAQFDVLSFGRESPLWAELAMRDSDDYRRGKRITDTIWTQEDDIVWQYISWADTWVAYENGSYPDALYYLSRAIMVSRFAPNLQDGTREAVWRLRHYPLNPDGSRKKHPIMTGPFPLSRNVQVMWRRGMHIDGTMGEKC